MIAAVLDRITPGVRDALAGWGTAAAFVALALRVALPPHDPVAAASTPPRAAISHVVTPRELLLPAVLGAVALCIAIRPWFGHGIPAFAHDWKWPLLRAQLDAWPSMLHSLWLPWGAGAPAVQELAQYPIVIAAWIIGHILSPVWTLYLVLVLIFVTGATGAAACARAFDLDARWQRLIAFVYPMAPAMTNRLSAGHLPWLLGFALVPWIVYFAVAREPSRGRAGALGMLWGCAAAQVQFLIIAPLALLVSGKRAFSRDSVLAALIACALQAPMIAALVWGHPGTAYAGAHANGDWQLAQSSRTSLALAGAADPVNYFQNFEPHAELFVAPLLALAFLAAWFVSRSAPLGLLWFGSALWTAGLRGPLAAPLGYAFDHSLVSSAFREFSHAEVLTTLPLLLLAAAGARIVAARSGAIALAVLALTCLPAVWPSIFGDAARLDTAVQPDPAYASLADSIAAMPGSGSVLWLPSAQPMRTSDTRGGADSLALPIGAHPPFVEYRPSVPLIVAIRAIDEGDRAACGLLADLGVQAVVDRADVKGVPDSGSRSIGSLERVGLHLIERDSAASLYDVPCYRGTITWASASVMRGDWLALRSLARAGATDEITLAPRPPAGISAQPPPMPTYESVDVARSWVPLSQADAYVRRFAGAFDDVVVTSRVDAPLKGSVELASTGVGTYSWRTVAQVRALLRVQPIAIWESGVSGSAPAPDASLERSVAVLPAAPSNAAAMLRSHSLDEDARALGFDGQAPPQGSLIVLHQHSSGGWRAFVDDVPLATYPADGFAVGWHVDHPGTLSIRYDSPPMWLLWSIVACAFAAAAAMAWPGATRRT